MVNKKFELTNETINFFGKKLFRIKSLIDFGGVKIGELGGFVEKEENLDIYMEMPGCLEMPVYLEMLKCVEMPVYLEMLKCVEMLECLEMLK